VTENLYMDMSSSQGSDGSYSSENSKVLEARLREARALIDPLTKRIPWEHLPKTPRNYTFGTEVISYLAGAVKVRLLIEHKMAWGGAGHCRKLNQQVYNFLESQVGYGLTSWELNEDYRSLSKQRASTDYNMSLSDTFAVEPDIVLEQWLGHYRKFLEKQAKKAGRVAVNLANVPYMCGPKEVKDGVEALLGWKGCVSAIDPWWKRDAWEHDGTVTVYLPKIAAQDLVTKCQNSELTLFGKKSSVPRVIKGWYAKDSTSRFGGSGVSRGDGASPPSPSSSSSDDLWE
jgi:hypothetical protein